MTQITKVFRPFIRILCRFWPFRTRIEIDEVLWQTMIRELGRRGLNGQREAGAFLLAHIGEHKKPVTGVIYFDDLDPNCLVGNIHIRSEGLLRLGKICRRKGLRVLADVHTHPSSSVIQSSIDRDNPMIARDGHLAIIVPHYGTRQVTSWEVGVHEYRRELGWTSWFGFRANLALRISKGKINECI